SHCLSLGTPVLSERRAQTRPHEAFEDCVSWFDESSLEAVFGQHVGTPAFYEQARAQLQLFEAAEPIEAYADILAFAAGYARVHQERRPQTPWQPSRINLGSGKDYKPGWLNVDILERAQPDLVLDLGQPVQWPHRASSSYGGEMQLDAGSVDTIFANYVLEHVPDLPMLMGNCLAL